MFTCPRVKETEGVDARTEWLEALKSLPRNVLSKALVVLEPHMADETTLDEWDDDTEEAKPPNHIHAFVWFEQPTDLLRVVQPAASQRAHAGLHGAHQGLRHRTQGHLRVHAR
jgi:hypothetical protein